MLSITSTMFFSIDHQSTSNDRLKPVMTTGLVNMHIDRSIANLALKTGFTVPYTYERTFMQMVYQCKHSD